MPTQDEEGALWKRMSFKGNKVWAEVDKEKSLLLEGGRVRIKYNLKQTHEYQVYPDTLKSDAPENLVPKAAKKKKAEETPAPPEKGAVSVPPPPQPGLVREVPLDGLSTTEPGVIHIFTDGASSGNPGPSGIGVFFRYGPHEREISRNIGQGTNNIAELEAIRTGLSEVKKPELPVRVYTDSSYALGLIAKGWKAQANQELVEEIRALTRRFSNLVFVKVKGHAGFAENEKADQLATSAIKN
ncbi:ribonuclease H [Desulfoluna sp.]|uniref:ribonuclease HI n=1 Tax=Desulfoluna sp. TaxID=2045199 RepID=UPI002610E9AE|nr:ribonuclease H [Desulfoluna sp.]